MCPPVSHAASNCLPGTGMPASSGAYRGFPSRAGRPPDRPARNFHQQHRKHSEAAQRAQRCHNSYDLRASMDALQSASVSSVETKSVVSDWPLPKAAGSASSCLNRRPSQSHTPSKSVGSSQPPGKRHKPSFSQQNEEFLRSAVLVRFPCGKNKDPVQKFCAVFLP